MGVGVGAERNWLLCFGLLPQGSILSVLLPHLSPCSHPGSQGWPGPTPRLCRRKSSHPALLEL